MATDPVPEGPFGAKTVSAAGESAADYMRCYPETDLAQWLEDRKESKYARWVAKMAKRGREMESRAEISSGNQS